MPGVSREPAHTHLYDKVILKIHDGSIDFDVTCCMVCGHYVIVTASKHRLANDVEAALIRRILMGV